MRREAQTSGLVRVLERVKHAQSNLVRLVSWRDREGRPGERADDDRLARAAARTGERGSGSGERSGHDLGASLV